MTTDTYTLRPGLLVSMTTSIKGNITYGMREIEGKHIDETGAQRAKWETTRVITDPAEHEEAIKQRTVIRGLILSVCSQTAFGLMCPNDKAEELTEAIVNARKLTDEFNATAKLSRMSVNVIYGRIARDDVEAVRAITGEVRSLMEDMQRGLKTLDVKAIRDAAIKAKSIGEMLSPEANERLAEAIAVARKSARAIAKAGDAAAIEVDREAIAKIDTARTSFLDMDDDTHVGAVSADARSIDMEY